MVETSEPVEGTKSKLWTELGLVEETEAMKVEKKAEKNPDESRLVGLAQERPLWLQGPNLDFK